ncbi:HVA22-like protein a [Sesamum angolense]|uniref:HVA22-like protein a n=1 Tax=Sesamum angolense TaxID=2727404 RepID=A0AAE1WJH2_9LAMI|nr:HVA22-like protein a [Sesamum angolense]
MGGSGAASFLKLVASNFDVLAGYRLVIFPSEKSAMPVVSLVYPLYASIRAIETKSPVDDQQWLLIGLDVFIIVKSLRDMCIPQLWLGKNSCDEIWRTSVNHPKQRNLIANYLKLNCDLIEYIVGKKDIFSKPDDILTAAEKYIEEHGPEAFEKMIHRSRETTTRSSNYTFYNDDYRYEDDYRGPGNLMPLLYNTFDSDSVFWRYWCSIMTDTYPGVVSSIEKQGT